MFYIFGVVNVASIVIVWALYPESNQRTLEEMDLLFAAPTPWSWDAEKKFKELKEQTPGLGGGTRERHNAHDLEDKGSSSPGHIEDL